ncbi:hypothetical protein OLF92_11005, partial [Streptococcus pneumoniae]|nr:hypothetical protein [Streptococcus pneumoniae]
MQTTLAAGLVPVLATPLLNHAAPRAASMTESRGGMRRTYEAEAEIFAEGDRAATFYKVVSGV